MFWRPQSVSATYGCIRGYQASRHRREPRFGVRTAGYVAGGCLVNGLHKRVDWFIDATFFRQRHQAERQLARNASALPFFYDSRSRSARPDRGTGKGAIIGVGGSLQARTRWQLCPRGIRGLERHQRIET